MEVEEQVKQLIEAVIITMDPDVNKDSRMKAYQLCEAFKDTSPHCVECGVLLADKKYSAVLRHFGLQLLEHFVRFKWNDASTEQKVNFKDMFLQTIKQDCGNILEEEIYIKEGRVKIMVEMIKREWPQQWPGLLTELNELCRMGDSQTELVLLVFLRLAEDVVTFQNLQQRRRRDVFHALIANMADILSSLLNLLHTSYDRHRTLKTTEETSEEARSAFKVTQTVLLTLSGFVEWVDFKHLFAAESRLLTSLYGLLPDDQLKLLAAECLQLMVNRKSGKVEERKPFLILLRDSAMTAVWNAAVKACNAGIDETNHLFVKKLCQVVTGLGSQISAIWALEGETFERPVTLGSYLDTLFAFTQHASTHVCYLTSTTWMAFLRHEHMARDPALIAMLPRLCQTFTGTLQKVGFPSRNDAPACAYSKIDFDSDDEFFHFFANHRHYQLEILRHATAVCPETTFSIAAHWLQELLAAPLQREEGKDLCTSHCPSYVKWDALTGCLDSVMATLIKRSELPVQPTVELLQATLSAKIEDPMILSCQLTCISTLFPVLHHARQHVTGVLDKLFAAAIYSLPGLTKTRTRSVQNVRRHACSAMVKMCRDHQELMLPHFEMIYHQIQILSADPDQLTQLERVTLYESLILINNGLHDFTRQSALIAEIMQPVAEILQSQTISEMMQSPEMFIHHVGLDHPSSSEPNLEEVHNRNRAQVFSCISTAQAVIKRSCWPADPQLAEAGGFISGHLPSGAPIYKNPSTPHIMPLLPSLFTLARMLNAIWAPEIKAKVCPEYVKSYDMTENERNTILGQFLNSTEGPTNRSVSEKLQIFLTICYETLCHIFSDCFLKLGYEFYAVEGLADQLLGSIFTNLPHLPDYRLKHIIRVVAKSLVQYCPTECWQSVLFPVMTGLCSYMVHRLNQQWSSIAERKHSSEKDEDEEQESQEVVEDHLIRIVTREFMELIGSVCWRKGHTSAGGGGVAAETKDDGSEFTMDMDDTMEQTEASASSQPAGRPDTDHISELGKIMLQNERLCDSMVTCVYSAMEWPDTGVCMKACRLSWLVIQQLACRPLQPRAVVHLFTSLLTGLQIHGEHDTCRTELVLRALQHYELLREKYPVLTEVMTSLPDCSDQALQQFHQRMLGNKGVSEKKKKDAFKKFLQGIIGQNIGQKFKKNEVIRDLPAIHKPLKPKRSFMDSLQGEDAGLIMLFAADDGL